MEPHTLYILYFTLYFGFYIDYLPVCFVFPPNTEDMFTLVNIVFIVVTQSEWWRCPTSDKLLRSSVWHLQCVSAIDCEGVFFSGK